MKVYLVYQQDLHTNENKVLKLFSTFEKARVYLNKLFSSDYDSWTTDYFSEEMEVE